MSISMKHDDYVMTIGDIILSKVKWLGWSEAISILKFHNDLG
jgi:hypothetical protein